MRLRDALGYRHRAACLVISPSTHPGHILLVGSSKAGIETRCVIPAGGIDPEDASASEAGRREAREEAGIEGQVLGLTGRDPGNSSPRPLALITDTKKLAKTQVFLLVVTREIPLSNHEEEEEEEEEEISKEDGKGKKKKKKKNVVISGGDDDDEDVTEVTLRGREWVPISLAATRLGGKEPQLLCLAGALAALRKIVNEDCSDEDLLHSGLQVLLEKGDRLKIVDTLELSTGV